MPYDYRYIQVAPELVEQCKDWQPCEGFKFVEKDDGLLELWITTDLTLARREDYCE